MRPAESHAPNRFANQGAANGPAGSCRYAAPKGQYRPNQWPMAAGVVELAPDQPTSPNRFANQLAERRRSR